MRNYALPDRDECLALIAEYHVPVHIVRHSEAAARLGVFLAERLNENGATVDVALVERACLLHDLFRVCDFPLEDFSCVGSRRVTGPTSTKTRPHCSSARATPSWPRRYASIATRPFSTSRTGPRRGRRGSSTTPTSAWEEKLVYYADKRVMHDTIVPLRERLEEAHHRSGIVLARAGKQRDINTEQKVDALIFHHRSGIVLAKAGKQRDINTEQKVDALIFKLEKEIFAHLTLAPDEITAEFIDGYAG